MGEIKIRRRAQKMGPAPSAGGCYEGCLRYDPMGRGRGTGCCMAKPHHDPFAINWLYVVLAVEYEVRRNVCPSNSAFFAVLYQRIVFCRQRQPIICPIISIGLGVIRPNLDRLGVGRLRLELLLLLAPQQAPHLVGERLFADILSLIAGLRAPPAPA